MKCTALVAIVLVSQANAQTWMDAPVRVVGYANDGTNTLASGTIIGSNGRVALVLTCRHFLRGVQRIAVFRRDGHGYEAAVAAIHPSADLSALMIKDTRDLPTTLISYQQPSTAFMIGFGGSRSPMHSASGHYLTTTNQGDIEYSFSPRDGDSGAGTFSSDGTLAGVVWGRSGMGGMTSSLDQVRQFLRQPQCMRYLVNPSDYTPSIPDVLDPVQPLICQCPCHYEKPPTAEITPITECSSAMQQ
jgi:hypothetical protein